MRAMWIISGMVEDIEALCMNFNKMLPTSNREETKDVKLTNHVNSAKRGAL